MNQLILDYSTIIVVLCVVLASTFGWYERNFGKLRMDGKEVMQRYIRLQWRKMNKYR